MYLHATQLANENDGIKSIMLREAALLASINCLNLAEVSFVVFSKIYIDIFRSLTINGLQLATTQLRTCRQSVTLKATFD